MPSAPVALAVPVVTTDVAVEIGAATQRTSFVPVLAVMAVLAALDLAGAGLARSWALHHSRPALIAGIVAFGVLFVVYAHGLRYADLTTVTIGWVVLLQIGVVVLDVRHGVVLPPAKLFAIGAILALQGYLIAG